MYRTGGPFPSSSIIGVQKVSTRAPEEAPFGCPENDVRVRSWSFITDLGPVISDGFDFRARVLLRVDPGKAEKLGAVLDERLGQFGLPSGRQHVLADHVLAIFKKLSSKGEWFDVASGAPIALRRDAIACRHELDHVEALELLNERGFALGCRLVLCIL